MSEDLKDYFRDMKQISQEKRANNRHQSTILLEKLGVKFETKNGGTHLIVSGPNHLIDFWPGTGRWIPRCGKGGRGVRNMLRYIERQKNESN